MPLAPTLQMELELLSYERYLVLLLSPLTMLGGEGILVTPSCSHPVFDVAKGSFACAAEKTLVRLAAARAGVRLLIPEEGVLQDPVSQAESACV